MTLWSKFGWVLSFIIGVSIFLLAVSFINYAIAYMKYGGCSKYYMDSPCFDWGYRCGVECSNYGLNFTGEVSGCECDCGAGVVSACSGFYYDYENPANDNMRITGDEVCTYANGTSEPCGYAAGIYSRGVDD